MMTNLTVLGESFIIWVSNSTEGTEHTQHTFDSLTAVSQSREWDSDILLCVVGVAVRCPIAKESHDLIYKRLPESKLS